MLFASVMGMRHERIVTMSTITAVGSLTHQFLEWVANQPRTYAETMEVWRTHCPRFTIWEDAIADELVTVESVGSSLSDARVVVTPRGRASLNVIEGARGA